MRFSPALVGTFLIAALSCAPTVPPEPVQPAATTRAAAQPLSPVIVSVVGTSDLHGHIETTPLLAGFLRNLRAARHRDGGVVLVDAGDMWQGTIVSNSAEGAPVVELFNALGYAAATIGNHEFDYGPEGASATPRRPTDDPRGAIKVRAKQASFPLLAGNILQADTGQPVNWPGVHPFTTVEVAGVRVGIVGVSTEETLHTTIASNVADLRMAPLAPAIAAHAKQLRADYAVAAVVVAAHAGARCDAVDDPSNLASCDDGELLRVARELPVGLVDVIVGGHTHSAIAHRVNNIAIIQSYNYGEAFGRVDLTIDRALNRVTSSTIHRPQRLCRNTSKQVAACDPGDYEGAPVVADPSIAALVADDVTRVEAVKARKLGVRVKSLLRAEHGEETPLGNLLADLMRAAHPGSDVALMNGGGIRADIPAGELTYGAMYETFPFDNRFAKGRVPARALASLLARGLEGDSGFCSISGVRVRATCDGGALRVRLERQDGTVVRDDEMLTVVASDYQVMTRLFADAGLTPLFEIEDLVIRDALVELLGKRGGELDAADKALFDASHPRVQLPKPRPIRCQ